MGRSLQDPVAAEAGTVAIAKLERLMGSRGRARGHAEGARTPLTGDGHLEGWVAARVQDLPRADGTDSGPGHTLPLYRISGLMLCTN